MPGTKWEDLVSTAPTPVGSPTASHSELEAARLAEPHGVKGLIGQLRGLLVDFSGGAEEQPLHGVAPFKVSAFGPRGLDL